MLPCLFSGLEADTNEHVIPDWLQVRFGLQRATYHLPNATGLDYRHAKVPAARACNEAFGKIETRISQNRFVWEELYLWLLKIHVGLLYRDASLRSDITDPHSPSIIPQKFVDNQIAVFRALFFQYVESGRFETHASPPGSVFILPSMAKGYFDFQHSFTCGCIGINIGDFYVAASLWDFGMAKELGYFDWVWKPSNYLSPPDHFAEEERAAWYNHAQSTWLCSLGYWSFRWNINMYRNTFDFQPAMPGFDGPPLQSVENADELGRICQTFGLELQEFLPNGKSVFRPALGRIGGA